jgi:hypothetical protein
VLLLLALLKAWLGLCLMLALVPLLHLPLALLHSHHCLQQLPFHPQSAPGYSYAGQQRQRSRSFSSPALLYDLPLVQWAWLCQQQQQQVVPSPPALATERPWTTSKARLQLPQRQAHHPLLLLGSWSAHLLLALKCHVHPELNLH